MRAATAGLLLFAASLLALAGATGCAPAADEPDDAFAPDAAAPDDASALADGAADAEARDLVVADLTPVVGPTRLADTGLYSDFAQRTLAPGVIHYVPRYQLWSDGAEKERYLLLPEGARIDTRDMDNWVFPVGTRVWKEFRVEGRLIETRLLQKVYDNPGGWWQVAYLWNPQATDAIANPDGTRDAGGTAHDVPSQEDCGKCHGSVSDVLIGVSAIQLSDGGHGVLSQLAARGLLSTPPAGEFQAPGEGALQETIGYLHGNCGHCHNDRSVWVHSMNTRLRLRVADRTPGDTDLYRTTIRVKMFHHMPPDIDYGVIPGAPEKSQLYVRAGLRDDWAMPPVCTEVPDAAGLALIAGWIRSLPP